LSANQFPIWACPFRAKNNWKVSYNTIQV
jgi:hypothetical protein